MMHACGVSVGLKSENVEKVLVFIVFSEISSGPRPTPGTAPTEAGRAGFSPYGVFQALGSPAHDQPWRGHEIPARPWHPGVSFADGPGVPTPQGGRFTPGAPSTLTPFGRVRAGVGRLPDLFWHLSCIFCLLPQNCPCRLQSHNRTKLMWHLHHHHAGSGQNDVQAFENAFGGWQ